MKQKEIQISTYKRKLKEPTEKCLKLKILKIQNERKSKEPTETKENKKKIGRTNRQSPKTQNLRRKKIERTSISKRKLKKLTEKP